MNLRAPDVVTIAVTRADGGLTVLRVIVAEYRPTTEQEKADGKGDRITNWVVKPTSEYIDAIIAKHGWKGTPYEAVSWEVVPNDYITEQTDRTFRHAWKHGGGLKPNVDMTKAKELHRSRLRDLRASVMEVLDVEYMRADEQGDSQEKKRIAARKQALRDITAHPEIEAATTPEELKVAALSLLI